MKLFLRTKAASLARGAREDVFRLVPYRGGKSLDELERRTGRRDFIKLASNENALGPSPLALAAMRAALRETHQYPEMGYPRLKRAIAREYGLKPRNVVLGDGSNEVLVLAASAFLRRGDEAICGSPSFAVFSRVITAAGGKSVNVPLRDFRYDLAAMGRAVNRRTRMIFICNPNNPTGTIVGRGEVRDFLSDLPGGLLCVFDEAYAEFVDDPDFGASLPYVRRGLGVLTVRTFAKLHGLAGLRVGYGLAPAPVIDLLERLRQPFNVNAVAYRAASAAIRDRNHIRATRRLVRRERAWLAPRFEALGIAVVPSQANFLLVATRMSGERLAAALLRRRIIVRALPGAVLKNHVRITVGTRAQNTAVLAALRGILGSKGGK